MGSPKVDHGVPKSRRSIYKEQRLLTEIEEKRGAVAPMSSSDELDGRPTEKAEAAVVFEYWKTVLQHPKAQLDSSRRQKIQRRLKEFTVADLKKAIDGVARSPFYLGDNDRKRKYDGIETIFRNAAKVEQFIEVAETASPLDVPGGLMDNEKALEERRRRLQ